MGPAVNLTRGWRKTIWPDWKPPGPPGKKMFELKQLTRCASAPSHQGVGQALTSLEPQICHGGESRRTNWTVQGTDRFLGRLRRQGQAGLSSMGSPRPALILMSD